MKKTFFQLLSLLILVGLSGCIKDEKPNIEVDILKVSSPEGIILNVVFSSDLIDVFVTPGTDLAALDLDFAISEGATITPKPEEVTDYTADRRFTVTSEDRAWSKAYTVSVRPANLPTRFRFENWRQPERMRYRIPFESTTDAEGNETNLNIWACGNEAYNFLTDKFDDYTVFPTQPTSEAAEGSLAAKLVTRLTGQIDRPIASGNLFIGSFDASLRDPLESTQFGLPFMLKPLRFTGKYKYRSGGETLKSGKPDCCKIQAVLYRTSPGVSHLNGYSIKNSPNIVARAELPEADGADTPGDGFATFDIPFAYTAQIDPDALSSGGYNLAVIFSASRNGDVYDGAPESVLIVDDIEIICDQPTDTDQL